MFLPILDGIAGLGQYSKTIIMTNTNYPEDILNFPAIGNNKALLLTFVYFYHPDPDITKIYIFMYDKDDNLILTITRNINPELKKMYYFYPNILLLPGNYIRLKVMWTTGTTYVVCSIAGLEFDYGGD